MGIDSLKNSMFVLQDTDLVDGLAVSKLTKMPEWKSLEMFFEREREKILEEMKVNSLGIGSDRAETLQLKAFSLTATLEGFDRLRAVPLSIAVQSVEIIGELKTQEKENYEANGIKVRDGESAAA